MPMVEAIAAAVLIAAVSFMTGAVWALWMVAKDDDRWEEKR